MEIGMNPISLAGAFSMTIALLLYGIGSISVLNFKMVSPGVLWFLTTGVFLNITAILLMILGFHGVPFSLHMILGLSAFLGMLVEVVFIWRAYSKYKLHARISKKLCVYTRIAIGWWIIAYITGSLLVIV